VGNFIPFVICINTQKEIDAKAGLSEKAFHPEELMDMKGKLEIDIQWYIT